jgi:lysozyme
MKLNRGEYEAAADEFHRWIYGGGRKLPGLVLRRKAEHDLFELEYTNGEDPEDS